MWLIFLLAVLAGPALIFYLGLAGRNLRNRAQDPVPQCPDWPSVGLIVPCAGTHPQMERALRSLLEQSYPGSLRYCFVTATADEPAAELVVRLAGEYADRVLVDHVVAGKAEGCGQKNHNSLQAVAHLGSSVDVYAFCDSTHLASPDFLTRLVEPVARGRAVFATGYHEVVPRDEELVTLAYAFCVLCMRLMQGLSRFTQPWGGAMAIERHTFEQEDIAGFWSTNVVDDCSLTTYLQKRHVAVSLCPAALLRTRAEHHSSDVWHAWLDRQILFLKFCVPAQWVLLGVLLGYMAVMPALTLAAFLGWVTGFFGLGTLFCVGVYLATTAVALSSLRPLLAHHVPLMRWLQAFWLTSFCAFSIFLKTVTARGILWHGIWYNVGPMGRVVSVERRQN